MKAIAGLMALALVACGDRGRPAPAAKTVDTQRAPADAGVDALTDEQRNAIALEAFMAADRAATDTRRAILDARARQGAEVQVVMQWIDSVRDGVPLDEPLVHDDDTRANLDRLLAVDPQLVAELVPGGVRLNALTGIDEAQLEYATLTFTLAPDRRGRLAIKRLVVDAPPAGSSGRDCIPDD